MTERVLRFERWRRLPRVLLLLAALASPACAPEPGAHYDLLIRDGLIYDGGGGAIDYAAAKAGLINFSKSIANLYSKEKITCNSIAIGLVKTKMSSKELSRSDGKKKITNIPIGRIAEMKEITSTIKFLISDEASYITGQCINIDCGVLPQ